MAHKGFRCENCHKNKKGCYGGRPCERCKAAGKQCIPERLGAIQTTSSTDTTTATPAAPRVAASPRKRPITDVDDTEEEEETAEVNEQPSQAVLESIIGTKPRPTSLRSYENGPLKHPNLRWRYVGNRQWCLARGLKQVLKKKQLTRQRQGREQAAPALGKRELAPVNLDQNDIDVVGTHSMYGLDEDIDPDGFAATFKHGVQSGYPGNQAHVDLYNQQPTDSAARTATSLPSRAATSDLAFMQRAAEVVQAHNAKPFGDGPPSCHC